MGRHHCVRLVILRRPSWVLQVGFSVLQHENLLDDILRHLLYHVHVHPHRPGLHEHGRVRPQQRRSLHLRKQGVHWRGDHGHALLPVPEQVPQGPNLRHHRRLRGQPVGLRVRRDKLRDSKYHGDVLHGRAQHVQQGRPISSFWSHRLRLHNNGRVRSQQRRPLHLRKRAMHK